MIEIEQPARPALRSLIVAMERLPRRQRLDIAARGRKATAAKAERIRRLTRAANAEARRWLASQAGR